MERTFALIQGTTVVNSIVADDLYIDYIRNEYTDIVETTDMQPIPGVGMVYDKEINQFTSPLRYYSAQEEIIDVEALPVLEEPTE
jgi:hypothetical protein